MITVLYPTSTNWFYARFAHTLIEDMSLLGVEVRGLASSQVSPAYQDDCAILIINPAEILFDCMRRGTEKMLRRYVAKADRRILVNMDSFHTPWFERQLSQASGLFTDIFDYGMVSQLLDETMFGLPLQWVKEAFCEKVRRSLPATRGARPIPWAFIGHETEGRAAFISAAMQTLPRNGFVYIPPLKPFDGAYGLDEVALKKVLSASNFYVWGSHHHHRYHECFRVCDSIAAGAIPVKVDPLHHTEVDLPWVHGSLRAFTQSTAYLDPDAAYNAAVARLDEQGRLGANFIAALETVGVSVEVKADA